MNDYEFDPEAACEAIREEIEWQIEEWKKKSEWRKCWDDRTLRNRHRRPFRP